MASCINKKEANSEFISICKSSASNIKIDYMDSMHGICEIKKELKTDTLNLKVYVSKSVKQKSFDIEIDSIIKYVKFDSKIIEIDKIDDCVPVYSGEKALEQLKKMKDG